MNTVVLAAIISAVSSIIVGAFAFLGTVVSNNKNSSKTQYRIEQLELKQEKHNKVIERTVVLEKVFAVEEEKIKAMDKEIAKIAADVEQLYKNTSKAR